MRMNERTIERILDALQYINEHFGQTFMEDDIYRACPKVTSNIIDLLDELGVITCTKDGISFDDSNFEEYRSECHKPIFQKYIVDWHVVLTVTMFYDF